MLFQFNITLTEEDYLAYNIFHALESAHGKKQVRKSRLFLLVTFALLLLLVYVVGGWTPYFICYVILLGLLAVIYMLLFKKILIRNIKSQLKRLKKLGKLCFEPQSTLEFHEDKMVEISDISRSEQSYRAFERICLLEDRYIILYRSSLSAFILPVPQIIAQANFEEFINFLTQTFGTIERY